MSNNVETEKQICECGSGLPVKYRTITSTVTECNNQRLENGEWETVTLNTNDPDEISCSCSCDECVDMELFE